MTSIHDRALGDAFEDLHPMVQARFGFTSDDDVACIGRGTMDYVRSGGRPVSPLLLVGRTHDTMFPGRTPTCRSRYGTTPTKDVYGRETGT